jgi:hypothetical protein
MDENGGIPHYILLTFTAFISILTPQEVRSSLFHREQLRAILALHGVPKPRRLRRRWEGLDSVSEGWFNLVQSPFFDLF